MTCLREGVRLSDDARVELEGASPWVMASGDGEDEGSVEPIARRRSIQIQYDHDHEISMTNHISCDHMISQRFISIS